MFRAGRKASGTSCGYSTSRNGLSIVSNFFGTNVSVECIPGLGLDEKPRDRLVCSTQMFGPGVVSYFFVLLTYQSSL